MKNVTLFWFNLLLLLSINSFAQTVDSGWIAQTRWAAKTNTGGAIQNADSMSIPYFPLHKGDVFQFF